MTASRLATLLAAALAIAACRRGQGGAESSVPGCDPTRAAPAGPCTTTLTRFDPARVYEALGPEVRDVEDRERAAFGIVGFHRAWIAGDELVYVRGDETRRFRPDAYRPNAGFCYVDPTCENRDPPLDDGGDPCGRGTTRVVLSAPDGGLVRECVTWPWGPAARARELLTGQRPLPRHSVIATDGSRFELMLGEALVHAGRAGRTLIASREGLHVLEGNVRGAPAPVHWSTTTPVRATEGGFLVVDLSGPAPTLWKIDRSGGTRLGAYAAPEGVRWRIPVALDGQGRLVGVGDDGSNQRRLIRAALGDAEATVLATYPMSVTPVNLVTGN